ncbi:MAG: EndoU domain-containing protein [Potamolinea sp.]
MKRQNWLELAVYLAIGLAVVLLRLPLIFSDAAYSQVPPFGTFTATRTCAAPRAINGLNPGNIQVSNNQTYQALGFNTEEQKFIQIKIPGANPERRWVSTSCGTFKPSEVISQPVNVNPTVGTNTTLLPFFDNVNNPEQHKFPRGQKVDITPPPPQLNQFDLDVLKTCGSIGSKVRANDFKKLISNYPEVLSKIQQAVGGELLPTRKTPEEFRDDLTTAWFNRGGFEHIFCGELEGSKKIGGLHFVGRYLQLQNQKIGGRLANNLEKEEVIPGVVYTLGVVIKNGNQIVTDDLKGYALVSNASEILVDGTKALKAQGNAQGACILQVRDEDSGKSFSAVFVKDRSAVVTFYPDATPNGKPCRS